MRVAAIFDLDDTLVAASTGRLIVRYLHQSGSLGSFIPRRSIATIAAGTLLYHFGLLDATRWVKWTVAPCKGIAVAEMWTLIQRWFDEMVVHHLSDEAIDRLNWHRDQDHLPVICTASSQYSALPVARYLGIEDAIYTNWEDDGEIMSGMVTLPITWGAGKVHWVRKWATLRDVDLSRSYCYTDHISDLPLLQAVGHGAVVNPNPELAELARSAGWSVLRWPAQP